MERILQANFDTALDARYAIARNVLWSTFIHPLSSLSDKEFLSGLGQAINIVINYGKSYSSGALSFGGEEVQNLLHPGSFLGTRRLRTNLFCLYCGLCP